MPINIEIKARVADLDRLRQRVENLVVRPAEVLQQEDIFFNIEEGRLKLRRQGDGTGQLIYYNRPDADGPKASDYEIYFSKAPDRLRAILADSLGERGIVKKTRRLYWVENTRVHLDEVVGLGSFMELEVVLKEGQTPDEGEATARDLCALLDISLTIWSRGLILICLKGWDSLVPGVEHKINLYLYGFIKIRNLLSLGGCIK